MDNKPSYTELERQIKRLRLESSRLKAAEETFNRQNESLKALHETSLVLIDTLDKEELLENILERAASLSGTAHGYIYLLKPCETLMEMKVGMGFLKVSWGVEC